MKAPKKTQQQVPFSWLTRDDIRRAEEAIRKVYTDTEQVVLSFDCPADPRGRTSVHRPDGALVGYVVPVKERY
jgi:hypothetical protein